MLISRSRRFVFVHIPKSAGTSIAAVLEKYCRPSLLRRALNRAGLWKIPGHPLHSSALKIRELLRPDFFDACFKFAFVRNPWDWHVSLYHYALQTSDPQQASVRASGSFDRYIEWRTAAASAGRSSL